VTVALVLAVVLAVGAVVIVAWPFLSEPEPVSDELVEPTPEAQRRLELAERRDRALGALKELEFDHRTRKITDDDYREQVGHLRREAAAVLRALDEEASPPLERDLAGRDVRETRESQG
jgi:hypothetical protein